MRELHLNDEQILVIQTTEGPIMVQAGAGTGKTTTIVERYRNLIKQRLAYPNEILMITFTDKAASELKQRVRENSEKLVSYKTIGTFHSFGKRILSEDIETLGYPTLTKEFSIIDENEKNRLFLSLMKELKIDPKKTGRIDLMISRHKADPLGNHLHHTFEELYNRYIEYNILNNKVDFDDMIILSKRILEKNKDIRDKWQNRLKYILVDEFQDVSNEQYDFLKLLVNENKNICVVGDTNQSIYGFRGGDIKNAHRFIEEFNPIQIELNINYRSNKNIIDLANNISQKNTERLGEGLKTLENIKGEKILLLSSNNDQTEANFIIHEIKELLNSGYEPRDIAILYRTHKIIEPLHHKLKTSGIPFLLLEQNKLLERKDIKDLIAYIAIIANPHHNHFLKRSINTPKRGIGKETIKKLEEMDIEKSIFFNLNNFILTGKNKTIDSLISFKYTLEGFQRYAAEHKKASKILKYIVEKTNFVKHIKDDSETPEEASERIGNILTLYDLADNWEKENHPDPNDDLESKLMEFAASFSNKDDTLDNYKLNSVGLLTIHASKGLEFPIVFLIGFEERTLPHHNSILEDNIDEERRLLYVAITRTQKKIIISISGRRNKQDLEESRFLSEFDIYAEIECLCPPIECYEDETEMITNEKTDELKYQEYLEQLPEANITIATPAEAENSEKQTEKNKITLIPS